MQLNMFETSSIRPEVLNFPDPESQSVCYTMLVSHFRPAFDIQNVILDIWFEELSSELSTRVTAQVNFEDLCSVLSESKATKIAAQRTEEKIPEAYVACWDLLDLIEAISTWTAVFASRNTDPLQFLPSMGAAIEVMRFAKATTPEKIGLLCY